MARWRKDNWPPKRLRQHENLPLYFGKHEDVFAFYETLAAMTGMADHIAELGGYKPRWLRRPKVEFGVRRVNLVSTTGKTSRRFTSLSKLIEKCGPFNEEQQQAILAALCNPNHVIVAHKAIQDIRAYIFTDRNREPKRERFMKNGLVLAVEEGCLIQDHSRQFRTQRKDSYSNPIAENEEWTVFVKPESEVQGRKRKEGSKQSSVIPDTDQDELNELLG